jgi:hypothetical protein
MELNCSFVGLQIIKWLKYMNIVELIVVGEIVCFLSSDYRILLGRL